MKRQDTFKLFKGQVQGKLSTLLLSWVLLLPIVLTACVSALPEEAQGQAERVAPLVEEAQVTNEAERVFGSTHLAENPELMIAGRYEGVVENEATGNSTFYAANPELMVAGRYIAPIVENEEGSSSTFFAANPELMVADRYTPAEGVTGSEFYANNPELMVAQRFTATTEK